MLAKLTSIRAIMLFFVLVLSLPAIAQKRITGKVIGPDSQPLPGVTVAVKGTNLATVTANDGTFLINLPPNSDVLVFSSVGYEVSESNVKDASTVDITMKVQTTSLNEVVITGYTAQARKNITGSVSVVKVADVVSVPSGNAQNQLQGRASGVTITTTGQPGDGGVVRIRGFSSFEYNNPLYLIDGVPTDNLGDINSNDIESIQVLKDAAAASIYGSRASNGVIIITTKKGKAGVVKVNYDAYYGSQDRGKGFDLLDPQGNADIAWLANRNSGILVNGNPQHPQYGNGVNPVLPDFLLAGSTSGVAAGSPLADPSKYFLNLDDVNSSYLIVPANKSGTNWYNEMFKTAPLTSHNLSVSGGSDKNRFYLGVNYFDQDGILLHTYYKRYTVRANSEFTIKNVVRIGENVQLSYNNGNRIGITGENEVNYTYRIQPIVPVYDIAGNWAAQKGAGLGNGPNPVAVLTRNKDNKTHNYKILGNVYAEIDFLRNFTLRTSFGGEQYLNNYYNYTFKTYENSENNAGNSYTEGSSQFRRWTWTNTLAYKKIISQDHEIAALVGTEAIEAWGRSIVGTRLGYFVDDPDFRSLATGSGVQTNDGRPFAERSLFSLFAKADYIYKQKYLIGGTIRRDGSSVFTKENRYSNFPAVTAGWRISREGFMQPVNWITDLKIRGSYGTMGNQEIDPDNAFFLFGGGLGDAYYDIGGTSNSVAQGFRATRIGNPNGKWETNITTNIGFDGTLFNGKLELVFDWYNKKTKDLLLRRPLPGLSGTATAPFVNVASMKNTGIDLALTNRGTFGRQFKYDATLTFTTVKNRITELAEGVEFLGAGGSRIGDLARNAPGQAVSSFFGYKVIGIFQDAGDVSKHAVQKDAAPGRFIYQDTDGDGEITDADRIFFGDPNPKFSYGLNYNMGYQGFDLALFFYGVQGKDVLNWTSWWTDFYATFQGAKSKKALYEAWSPTNKSASLAIVENNNNFSNAQVPNSYIMENGSYLRLKSLIIGYTLPRNLMNRVGIDKLRVYIQATNLFTITDYSGLDPEFAGENIGFGIDYGSYPNTRQYIFGLNVAF